MVGEGIGEGGVVVAPPTTPVTFTLCHSDNGIVVTLPLLPPLSKQDILAVSSFTPWVIS